MQYDAKHKKLTDLIAAEIAASPVERDGFQWCGLPQVNLTAPDQKTIASLTGFSVTVINRLIKVPPIVRKRVSGMTLLRVGEPGPETAQDIAMAMGRYFNAVIRNSKAKWTKERQGLLDGLDLTSIRPVTITLKRVKRLTKLLARPDRHTRNEFGCMNGLAEVLPAGHQLDLFKIGINRWPTFMAGAKFHAFMEDIEDKADTVMTDKEFDQLGLNRHLEFPSLRVMRRRYKVLLEIAEMDAQEGGKQPVWLKAMTTFKPK